MNELKITPTICRLLLFIRYCGDFEKDLYSFKGKTLFVKWYFLSRTPILLKKLFSEKNIPINFGSSSDTTDAFIRCHFGVYMRNFESELGVPVYYNFIKVRKKKNTNIYTLTEEGLEIVKECQKNKIFLDFIKILIEIKTHSSKFSQKDIISFTNREIKKYEKKIGTLIRDDELEI